MNVLASDVLIDVIGQREPAFSYVARVQRSGELIGTTSINAAEVMRGVAPGTRSAERVARVLAAFQELPFGPASSRRFGAHARAGPRRSSIPAMDGLIAAVVLESGGRLVTHNLGDFSKVPGMDILVPS